MGTLMTSSARAATSDISVADQPDMLADEDTIRFGIPHEPYLKPHGCELLSGLEPPKKLVRDWIDFMLSHEGGANDIPRAWEETEYEERYRYHVIENGNIAAERCIKEIDDALKNHDVCIVCGCDPVMYQYCPRRILYDELRIEKGSLAALASSTVASTPEI